MKYPQRRRERAIARMEQEIQSWHELRDKRYATTKACDENVHRLRELIDRTRANLARAAR
jgi:hypothetical protein